MYKGKKIIGIITARGGSKGIPGKNIKNLAGQPLLAYTIISALKSRYLDHFLVSTDDPKIIKVAKKYKAPVSFHRPKALATNTAKSIPVVIHALDWLRDNRKQEFDYVMILQPTSPFRNAKDIDECIKRAIDNNADSVMSMVKLSDFSLPKLKKLKGELILPLVAEEGKISASKHEMPVVYKRNCAIYLTKVRIIRQNDLFGKKSLAYIMSPERSIDINTPLDFMVADVLMRQVKDKRLILPQ